MASLLWNLLQVKELLLELALLLPNLLFKSPDSKPDFRLVRKILVVHADSDSLGENVLATVLLKPLREAFPKARISYLVLPKSVPFFKANPLIDQVLEFPAEGEMIVQNPLRAIAGLFAKDASAIQMASQLKRASFDLVILKDHSLRFIVMAWLAKIPFRAGVDMGGRGFLLNTRTRLPRPLSRTKHEVEYVLDILRALGVRVSESKRLLNVWPTKQDVRNARKLVAGLPHPLVCLHAFSRGVLRAWPVDYWIELSKNIQRKGWGVIWLAGPENLESGRSMAKQTKSALFVSASPAATVALIDMCDVFVSSDGGPVHLAAATSAAVIALFCHTNPTRYGPFTPNPHAALMCPGAKPCDDLETYGKTCAFGNENGMQRLEPKTVLNAVEKMVAQQKRGKAI